MKNFSDIVTTEEFSGRLGITPEALRKRIYRDKGDLPLPVKMGRHVIWPRKIVEHFFNQLTTSKGREKLESERND